MSKLLQDLEKAENLLMDECLKYDLCDACPFRSRNMCVNLIKYVRASDLDKRYKILKTLSKSED